MSVNRKEWARRLQEVLKTKLKEGDQPEALKLVDRILELFPSSSKHWALKGLLHYEDRDTNLAIEAASKSIEVDPESLYGLLLLAKCHDDLGDKQEAALFYRKFANLRKTDWAFTLLANAELSDDPKGAAEDAKKALDLNPDWDEAAEILAKARRLLATE